MQNLSTAWRPSGTPMGSRALNAATGEQAEMELHRPTRLTGFTRAASFGAHMGMSNEEHTLDALRIDRNAAPKGGGKGWLLLVLLLIVVIGLAVVWFLRRPQSVTVRTVPVMEASSGGQQTLLNGSGYVTARREATVSSKVTGKVVEVLVEEGMKVNAGQVLARLDPTNVEATLRLAGAQEESARKGLEEIKANLDQARREWHRVTELAAGKIASQSELDRADADVKSLAARLARQAADVAVAEQQVALTQQQLEDTVIRAPFTGIVTTKNAQPGEMISPMSSGGFTRTGICTVVDMNSLEIEVDVNESYINRVTAGQPVVATLDAYQDWRIPAKVIAIIPTADRQKATVKVRVGFEQLDPRILPDMGVKVAFQSKEDAPAASRVITIPKTAVRQLDGRDIVWVVTSNRTERRAVTVSTVNGEQATISAGLTSGERVVVEGPVDLADGKVVSEKKS